MGARLFRKRRPPAARRKEESLTLAMIMGAVGLPLILAYVLVASDMRIDLSDLKPAQALADHATTLIGWPDLEAAAQWHSPSPVRMIGYMMDGYQPSRDGAPMDMFMLMPEAGQFLHPAHRIPKEMVEIWLTGPVPFQYRRLVWVAGVLARKPGRPVDEKASYAITGAGVEPAPESDITRWFKP